MVSLSSQANNFAKFHAEIDNSPLNEWNLFKFSIFLIDVNIWAINFQLISLMSSAQWPDKSK
jgi:hypothetical protein